MVETRGLSIIFDNFFKPARLPGIMILNIPREKVLAAVQEGPTWPIKIARKVGGDTMIIGAILSTLIESGEVAVSTLKIGGSPLYYMPGQEDKLEGFIDHLNEKDQKTFRILREKKLLQDSAQDPLIRVSLRILKDFAKQFEVEVNGRKETFWRFYAYDKDEALKEAMNMLSQKSVVIKTEEKIEKIEEKHEKAEPHIEPKVVIEYKIEHKPEEHRHKEIKKTEPGILKKDFFESIKKHVHQMNLDIISKEKLKKTEYTMILKNHDTNEYIYCIAKDKKNINEGDLSTAFVYAHSKKMPCIFLMTGTLTKKAEHMVEKEFKDMKIEKIE